MSEASTGGSWRDCSHCDRRFQSYRRHQPYCGQECYHQARRDAVPPVPCPSCGEMFRPRSVGRDRRRTYCSEQCKSEGQRGTGHPNWTGGRGIDSLGYVRVQLPGGPRPREHRLVMEAHLGRRLGPREHVHHRNHDKTDNRIENLELLSAREHALRHKEELVRPGPRMIDCPRCGRHRKHQAKGLCRSCYSYANRQVRLAADPEGTRAKIREQGRRDRLRRRAD